MRSARKQSAINDLLERTGAESIDDVLTAFTEYQGIQEARSTEADRANAKAEKLEARAKAAESATRQRFETSPCVTP